MQVRSGHDDPRAFNHPTVFVRKRTGEFVCEEVDEIVLGCMQTCAWVSSMRRRTPSNCPRARRFKRTDAVDDCFSSPLGLSEVDDPRCAVVPDGGIEPDEVDSRRRDLLCELLDGSERFQLERDPFHVVAVVSGFPGRRIGRAVSSIDGPAFGGGEEEALQSERAERGRAADCDEDRHRGRVQYSSYSLG